MHKEILNQNQLELLSLIKEFKREYYMVGGTAIALHLGHRMSIDFDLFKFNPIKKTKILAKIAEAKFNYLITRNVYEQLNLIINDVKFMFFQYPYKIEANITFEDFIRLPDLLTLAAMKAYALGRRSKWKDYVDLFFIIKSGISLEDISIKANEIYGQLFSEKMFRIQLSYFDDIDYSEEVVYLKHKIDDNGIKDFLIEISTDLKI